MNLAKIVFLSSAYLFLNMTAGQAVQTDQEQGSSSSSSTAAPSSFLTPLQEDANQFLLIWEGRDEEDNNLGDYESYINQIIRADNLRVFSPLNSGNNLPSNENELVPEFFSSTNINARRRIFKELCQSWEGLINEDNAFANYFLGYLLAEQINPKKYSLREQETIRSLLENSSQKLYSRATNFLLKNFLWQKTEGSRNDLLIRSNLIKEPLKALYRYIKIHDVKGQATWLDLRTLESTLFYTTNNPKEYLKNYYKLAKNLNNSLRLRKERESPLRIVEFLS